MTGADFLQSRATGVRLSLLQFLRPMSLSACLLCPFFLSHVDACVPRCAVGRARRAGGHFVVLVNDGDGQDDVWDMERRAREFNDKDKLDEQAAMQVGSSTRGRGWERMQGTEKKTDKRGFASRWSSDVALSG